MRTLAGWDASADSLGRGKRQLKDPCGKHEMSWNIMEYHGILRFSWFSKPFPLAPVFGPCEHRIHQSRNHGTRAMVPTLIAADAKKVARKEILAMPTAVDNMLPGALSNHGTLKILGGMTPYDPP